MSASRSSLPSATRRIIATPVNVLVMDAIVIGVAVVNGCVRR
jgi:hypothetical protein